MKGNMSEDKQYRLHAYIKGRVQGVSFRYFALRAAQDQHLTGWVRNLWDGRVEVLAEGNQEALNRFVAEMRKGPISSGVEDVAVEYSDASGEFKTFQIRTTA